MNKIFDYNTYLGQKNKKNYSSSYDFTFEDNIKYTDISINNIPNEYEEVSDAKVLIKYGIRFDLKRSGIEDIYFDVDEIEFKITFNKYYNDNDYNEEVLEIDLTPNINISSQQIKVNTLDRIIPSYVSKIELDMGKSNDINKFKIEIDFGKNY